MMDRVSPTVSIHCQLWYHNEEDPKKKMPEKDPKKKMAEPSVAKVAKYNYIWRKTWGNYKQGILQPYLLSCPIPKSKQDSIPDSVSLVEKPCEKASNNLRITYNELEDAEKEDFCVCVKGLDILDDISVRLVEWIEILLALGVHKIFIYKLHVHQNVTKVFDYYEKKGVLDVRPLTLPGDQPNNPSLQYQYLKHKIVHKRQNEVVPYNDCLYRNIYRYKYISLLDLDEVIVPTNASSWAEMLAKAKEKEKGKDDTDTYNFRNVYFMDDMLLTRNHGHFSHIPPYLHMMQHVYRSKEYTKPLQYVKCFHDTQLVLTLHNHFPFSCLSGYCRTTSVSPGLAKLQHYRSDCVVELRKKISCTLMKNTTVKDTSLWRWGSEVINGAARALWDMGFFGHTPAALPPFLMKDGYGGELASHGDVGELLGEVEDLHDIIH